MSGFQEREDAFEKKYAHDQEIMFKVEARCCKLFGLWAAEQLGLSGDDAATYAKEVVAANLEEPGFDDVKRKVMPDFEAKNVDIAEDIIDSKLTHYEEEAKKQIVAEQGS